MESSKFTNNVIDSLEEYPYHISEYDKLLDIQTFKYLVDEFDIEGYLNGFQITKEVFDNYFKDTVKKYDKPLYKQIRKDFKNNPTYTTDLDNIYDIDDGYVDRDYIFESIMDSDDYYENDYQKLRIINFLQYFFDKFHFEKHLYSGVINKTEYEVYFRDTVKEFNPKLNKQIMEKFKNGN